MKTKKFKLERKILEEVHKGLLSLLERSKYILSFIQTNHSEDKHNSNLLILYSTEILTYLLEIEKILADEGKYYLISSELMEKLNSIKSNISRIETNFHTNSIYSLKVH